MIYQRDYIVLVTSEAPLHVLGSILWRWWDAVHMENMPYAWPFIYALAALENEKSTFRGQGAVEVIEGLVGANAYGQRGVLTYWRGDLAEAVKSELWVRLRFMRGQ